VKHTDAWHRLPDLLDDRDDAELLGHVRGCADCQRQLFLLGRVDRMLHDQAGRRPRRLRVRWLAAGAAVAAAVAASLVLLAFPDHGSHEAFTLRTATGQQVGRATMGHSDAGNLSLALVAHDLPVNEQHVLMLWAGDGHATMEVGRFMVNRNGGCRARFNLPATHPWHRFWVAEPGNAAAVVAST
jgi:hypothetical protein